MPYLRPVAGHLLVEPIPESSDSIIIPDTAKKDLQSQFKVVSVGRGKVRKLKNGSFLRLMPLPVHPGDVIVANTFCGREVPVDGKRMRLIEHESVMAVIETT